jgi:hypothetical protein
VSFFCVGRKEGDRGGIEGGGCDSREDGLSEIGLCRCRAGLKKSGSGSGSAFEGIFWGRAV